MPQLRLYFCVTFHGSVHLAGLSIVYMLAVACLNTPSCVCKVTSHANSISRLQWLLCIFCSAYLFSIFYSVLFYSAFPFPFMFAPTSGGGAGAGVSRSAGRSKDTNAAPQFPVSDVICGYCEYLDSRRFAAMLKSGHRASMSDCGSGAIAVLLWSQ